MIGSASRFAASTTAVSSSTHPASPAIEPAVARGEPECGLPGRHRLGSADDRLHRLMRPAIAELERGVKLARARAPKDPALLLPARPGNARVRGVVSGQCREFLAGQRWNRSDEAGAFSRIVRFDRPHRLCGRVVAEEHLDQRRDMAFGVSAFREATISGTSRTTSRMVAAIILSFAGVAAAATSPGVALLARGNLALDPLRPARGCCRAHAWTISADFACVRPERLATAATSHPEKP